MSSSIKSTLDCIESDLRTYCNEEKNICLMFILLMVVCFSMQLVWVYIYPTELVLVHRIMALVIGGLIGYTIYLHISMKNELEYYVEKYDDMDRDFEFVERVLKSCETDEQIEVAHNLVKNFKAKYDLKS